MLKTLIYVLTLSGFALTQSAHQIQNYLDLFNTTYFPKNFLAQEKYERGDKLMHIYYNLISLSFGNNLFHTVFINKHD